MAKLSPILNTWYQDAREDQLFEVVAVDEQEGAIEIQYADGDVGEIDFETWQQMVLLSAQAPEDWSGSNTLENNDFDSNDQTSVYFLEDPLASVEPDGSLHYDDF